MLTFDHFVISVQDLDTATKTYQDAGFTVIRGGKHASGMTHNALVIFSDGTYLELIALVDPNQRDDSEFKELVRDTEGYTGYAFVSSALEDDLAAMIDINVSPIREGSRTTTDGIVLQWKMALLDGGMSPFVIQDVTPRENRVPTTPDNTTHANGATGIAALAILVADIEPTITQYRRILNTQETRPESNVASFRVGSANLTITAPQDKNHRDYVSKFGAVPYKLTLRSNQSQNEQVLHGARFAFST